MYEKKGKNQYKCLIFIEYILNLGYNIPKVLYQFV
jgi:hypothetical protein